MMNYGDAEYIPIIGPEQIARLSRFQTLGYYNWYVRGGLYGNPKATELGGIEPPLAHPLRRTIEAIYNLDFSYAHFVKSDEWRRSHIEA